MAECFRPRTSASWALSAASLCSRTNLRSDSAKALATRALLSSSLHPRAHHEEEDRARHEEEEPSASAHRCHCAH